MEGAPEAVLAPHRGRPRGGRDLSNDKAGTAG